MSHVTAPGLGCEMATPDAPDLGRGCLPVATGLGHGVAPLGPRP